MRCMLDTNICIYTIKRRPANVIDRLRRLDVSDVGISSITLSELQYGAAKSSRPDQNRIALMEFLAPIEIAFYDDAAAFAYGDVRASLEKRGRPLGALDMLIAAHALSLGATLVTNDKRAFGPVPGLQIENWAR